MRAKTLKNKPRNPLVVSVDLNHSSCHHYLWLKDKKQKKHKTRQCGRHVDRQRDKEAVEDEDAVRECVWEMTQHKYVKIQTQTWWDTQPKLKLFSSMITAWETLETWAALMVLMGSNTKHGNSHWSWWLVLILLWHHKIHSSAHNSVTIRGREHDKKVAVTHGFNDDR